MKKVLAFAVSFLVITGFTLVIPAIANLPKGLEDKGPLTKIVFIHYKKGFGHKPQHNPPGGNGNGGGPSCYTLLAKDAKWKTIENAEANPTNSGLSESFLVTNTLASREVWDAETSQELFGGAVTVNSTADWDGDTGDSPDGRNEYVFGITDPGVIAVTVVWGFFFGPPQTRELLEYDVLFTDAETWGDATTNSSLMDYLNIATHETGHGAGLGDVYEVACSEVTMFGFSENGETKKRTLEPQDINGLHKLYPA